MLVVNVHGDLQVKEEEQLLLFALEHAEQFEPLRRWIELQLDTNPALAGVTEIIPEHSASYFLVLLSLLLSKARGFMTSRLLLVPVQVGRC